MELKSGVVTSSIFNFPYFNNFETTSSVLGLTECVNLPVSVKIPEIRHLQIYGCKITKRKMKTLY